MREMTDPEIMQRLKGIALELKEMAAKRGKYMSIYASADSDDPYCAVDVAGYHYMSFGNVDQCDYLPAGTNAEWAHDIRMEQIDFDGAPKKTPEVGTPGVEK